MPEHTWSAFRTYLKELLRDAEVRKRIEERTEISPRTLSRWVSGETEEPDRKRLLSLVRALPQYRETLLEMITQALPDFVVPLLDPAASLLEDLPQHFWIRLLETHSNTPANLHFLSMVHLVFLQLQASIDPEHVGVQLTLAQCSPPRSPDQPVRSLREVLRMTTYQSLLTRPNDALFLGAESLCGYCVSACQASIVQDTEEERYFPVRKSPQESSAAAYPIQRRGYVAGCLLVSSHQPHYFTQQLQYVLQIYAYVLALAFEPEQFYAQERIRLGFMPAEQSQYAVLAEFQKRVKILLKQMPSYSRLQAETEAWQQIEDTLLSFSSTRE